MLGASLALWLVSLSAHFVDGAAQQAVQLPHDWKAGTRYHVEITSTRETTSDEGAGPASSMHGHVDVEVLTANERGYIVRWIFAGRDLPPEQGSALDRRILALTDDLVVDFTADAGGSVTGFVDPTTIDAHIAKKGLEVLATMEKEKASAADLQLMRSAIARAPAPARAGHLQLANRFYLPSGATLVPGERRTYEDQLPNPFGGDPLPAQGSLLLREVRAAKDPIDNRQAVVEWRLSIDPVRAGPILNASIRAQAKRTGQTLPEGDALTFDAIEDAATYVYDLSTGIPRSVVSTRTTVMAGSRQLDTTTYTVTAFTGPKPPAAPPPK